MMFMILVENTKNTICEEQLKFKVILTKYYHFIVKFLESFLKKPLTYNKTQEKIGTISQTRIK